MTRTTQPIEPGQTYGRWTVLETGIPGKRFPMARCRCECGTTRDVVPYDLRTGKSSNCGCVRRQKVGTRNRTHGMTYTREYVVWCGMIARCTNPKHRSWGNYGGRGITVCDRWRESFEAFLEDMGMPPTRKHTIDRIDNDGHYEPGNVRWVTNLANSRNRPAVRVATICGTTRSIAEWADLYGVPRNIARLRICRLHWTPLAALTTPVMSKSEAGVRARAKQLASRSAH